MTYQVSFTEEAEADVERLTDFLVVQAKGDWVTVDRAIESIRRGITQLEFSPFGYRKVGADNAFLRELVVGFGSTGYVVLFEIRDAQHVTVLAVRHQREDDYH